MRKKIIGFVAFLAFFILMLTYQPMLLNKVYHEELDYDVLISANDNLKKDIIKKRMLRLIEKIYHKTISQDSYTIDVAGDYDHQNYWIITASKSDETYQLVMDMESQKLVGLDAKLSREDGELSSDELKKKVNEFWQISEVKFSDGFVEEKQDDVKYISFSVLSESGDSVADVKLDKSSGQVIYYQSK